MSMAGAFGKFKNRLVRYGLEYFGLYYSFYDAVVTDRDDPKKMGRVRFRCEELGIDSDYWAFPIGLENGGGGKFSTLPAGSHIFVRFKYGNIRNAYFEPAYAYEGKYPAQGRENYADRYGFETPGGNYIYMDDKAGEIHLRLKGGNGIKITSKGVEIAAESSATAEPVVLGEQNASVHRSVQAILLGIANALVVLFGGIVASIAGNPGLALLSPLAPLFTAAQTSMQGLIPQINSLTSSIQATKSQKNKTD